MLAAVLLTACGQPDTGIKNETGTQTETSVITQETDNSGEPDWTDGNEEISFLGIENGYINDYYWDEVSGYAAVSLQYPRFRLSEADSGAYPALAASVKALSDTVGTDSADMFSSAVSGWKETHPDGSAEPDMYSVSETVTVRRADSRAVSLLCVTDAYIGGMHGQTFTSGAVFDTESGERLKLSDIVTDTKQLCDLAVKELENCWGEYLYESPYPQLYLEENLDSVTWVLDYHGITFYFDPYAIAPYATGTVCVTVSFADCPELFYEKYSEAPAGFALELPERIPFCFDIDNDGEKDMLLIMPATGEEPLTVSLNGELYNDDTGVYTAEPSFIRTADGGCYLYIGQQYPDDIWAFEILALSANGTEKVETVFSQRHTVSGSDFSYRQVLTDPECFVLDTVIQMLGTSFCFDTYRVGADGLLVKEHDWYTVCGEKELTLLKDLAVTAVGEDGKTAGSTELKAGEKVIYYRTDGKGWADLKLTDGRIVRIEIQNGDGEWTVNGTDIEEVFDGIVFGI